MFGQTPGLFRFTSRRTLGAEESLPLTERRTQRRLELFPTSDLRFERLRTLLQQTDLDQSRALVALDVPFRRYDVRVLGADRGEDRRVCRVVEPLEAVAAQQRKLVRIREPVPERLQRERAASVPLAPEQIDHLAIGADLSGSGTPSRRLEQGCDRSRETRAVRIAVQHEGLQRRVRVQFGQHAPRTDRREIDTSRRQLAGNAVAMLGRGNNDPRLIRFETGVEIVAHGANQKLAALVELHRVAGGISVNDRQATALTRLRAFSGLSRAGHSHGALASITGRAERPLWKSSTGTV